MEPRSRIPVAARRVALAAAMGALLVPAAAQAAPTASAAKAKKRSPVVTAVSPSKVAVGGELTIRGRYFRPGKGKNSVIFQRPGARAVFVKADLATTKMLTVRLPKTLERFLAVRTGQPQPTVFRVRIMAVRLGKTFTSEALSPTVFPAAAAAPGAAPGSPAGPVGPVDPAKSASAYEDGDCDSDGVKNGVDADDDDDLMADALEASFKLDACKLDTDGDGVQDGYEYRSALDLNESEDETPNTYLPFPSKRPYPNPLVPGDADVDFDGDTLTLAEEQALWLYSARSSGERRLDALTYSDGMQHSRYRFAADGRRVPTLEAAGYDKHQCFLDWADPDAQDSCITGEREHGYLTVALASVWDEWHGTRTPFDIRDFDRSGGPLREEPSGAYEWSELTYYDHDNDGVLSDDERDEDADGLTNFQEARNCMRPDLWAGLYETEVPYYRTFQRTDLADEDSDGDEVRDGADDQDNDDLPNLMECSRNQASGYAIDSGPHPWPHVGFVNPFNPCLPAVKSRTCNDKPPLSNAWAPFTKDVVYFLVRN